MPSDAEDDYLSDKFLLDAASASSQTAPKTYAQRRQQALKQSQLKNEQNRLKSRRQREVEAREEGLSKSLFERAQEEKANGASGGGASKALGIMMKMGFKMGQSLGQTDPSSKVILPASTTVSPPENEDRQPSETVEESGSRSPTDSEEPRASRSQHKTEPLPLNEWTGKKGIGLGKRTRSPLSTSRVAKMAKMAEDAASHETFRDRARREYEERRAEGRLGPAQRTCQTLDEKAGILFNVLCLNPADPEAIPQGLIDALADYAQAHGAPSSGAESSRPHPHRDPQAEATRLRNQMRADALLPVNSSLDGDDDDDEGVVGDTTDESLKPREHEQFSPETVEEAAYFLRLGPRDRLRVLLTHLRDKYAYCFWCGTQYEDQGDMERSCPGTEEDDHD
ncbi:hypothetical protein BV22DRAFT_1040030 [Leucogyrophana mollusca]|uniref:Uncharacterized protein n=1 Tax=Leucogyrophana mollusca TaxID=85980 RepID=A0ACB8B3M9_9AGAM|nr:hypothetical protein BV22DRAFT_1040030 [Leucogyrophana mollusca]